MENQKNNKGVIALLIIIIIILSTLCVLFATGTIKFETNNTDDNKTNENNKENLSNNNQESLDENLKSELENTFTFVYDYFDAPNGYCGDYSTFDEMIEDLKNYMTEQIIYKNHSTNRNEYKEENGKLLCPDYGKGGVDEIKEFAIKTIEEKTNNIYTTIEATREYEVVIKELYEVTFEKKDNKWIISSYEKIEQ